MSGSDFHLNYLGESGLSDVSIARALVNEPSILLAVNHGQPDSHTSVEIMECTDSGLTGVDVPISG